MSSKDETMKRIAGGKFVSNKKQKKESGGDIDITGLIEDHETTIAKLKKEHQEELRRKDEIINAKDQEIALRDQQITSRNTKITTLRTVMTAAFDEAVNLFPTFHPSSGRGDFLKHVYAQKREVFVTRRGNVRGPVQDALTGFVIGCNETWASLENEAQELNIN
jgi:hypothetical protein